MLLQYGANPNAHDNLDIGYCTPLHRAAENESLQIVRALVEGGADVNERNKLGQTALHIACRTGNVVLAKYLLSAEADPTIRDIMSCNPSFYAKREGLTELLEVLPAAVSLEAQHVYDNQKFLRMVLPSKKKKKKGKKGKKKKKR